MFTDSMNSQKDVFAPQNAISSLPYGSTGRFPSVQGFNPKCGYFNPQIRSKNADWSFLASMRSESNPTRRQIIHPCFLCIVPCGSLRNAFGKRFNSDNIFKCIHNVPTATKYDSSLSHLFHSSGTRAMPAKIGQATRNCTFSGSQQCRTNNCALYLNQELSPL